jgi:DDE superfamily endonuclease
VAGILGVLNHPNPAIGKEAEMELTPTFVSLLQEFACVFTVPTQLTFVALMTGWCLSFRHRYVTELIQSSGSTHKGHYCRYHRFFSQAAWVPNELCRILARLLVTALARTGVIELAVDDTLCRKRGLTIYGTGMHHDPLISSRAMKLVSWGHDWVVICLLLRCPFWSPTKVWALPIAFRLYRNRQGLTKGKKKRKKDEKNAKAKKTSRPPGYRTRPELAVELICLVAAWFPDRQIMVSGDSAYGGKSVLRHVPVNVDLISHVHPKGGMYEPAPPRPPEQKGRGRKKGKRLSVMTEWAADATRWRKLVFDQFGLHATLKVKTRKALYYKAGGTRLLNIVLVRDTLGKRPDQMFYCTNLDWDAQTILSTYACRWAIEVTFENSKQLLGFEDSANRTPKAVERTAPMALVLYSLIVLWFHQHGHQKVEYPDRPWYVTKEEPSFADQLSTLRRLSWEEISRGADSKRSGWKKLLAQLVGFISRAS